MSVADLLERLIAFPSVSSTSNEPVSDYVEQELRQRGFETERLSYRDATGELKVCVSGRRGPTGRGLAWFGHTDVVPVDSWSFPDGGPWDAVRTEQRIYGRGACDMKGSLACILAAAERVPELSQPLFIVCTADEEVGYGGAAKVAADSDLYREIVDSRTRGIIGEPTELQVVYGHKGGRVGRIEACGTAAHSSTNHGHSATMALLPFLSAFSELTEELRAAAEWQDDRFDPPGISMNLCLHDDNSAINITSPRCHCTYYFRPMPGQDAEGLVRRIEELAVAHGLQSERLITGSPVLTDPACAFVQQLAELTCSTPQTVPYGTDGSLFTAVQELAVLGPGNIQQAHTDDEWISMEQLTRGVDLYEQIIRECCTKPL